MKNASVSERLRAIAERHGIRNWEEMTLRDFAAAIEGRPIRIDMQELREANVTIEKHANLLRAAESDLGGKFIEPDRRDSVLSVIAAIDHVVDDGFRSDETRGGS
jgi:hypothetical protein